MFLQVAFERMKKFEICVNGLIAAFFVFKADVVCRKKLCRANLKKLSVQVPVYGRFAVFNQKVVGFRKVFATEKSVKRGKRAGVRAFQN